jgi:uncharacterized alpha-E superfamily protein
MEISVAKFAIHESDNPKSLASHDLTITERLKVLRSSSGKFGCDRHSKTNQRVDLPKRLYSDSNSSMNDQNCTKDKKIESKSKFGSLKTVE